MTTRRKQVQFVESPNIMTTPVLIQQVPTQQPPAPKRKAQVVIPDPSGVQQGYDAQGNPIQFVWVPQGAPQTQQKQAKTGQDQGQDQFQHMFGVPPLQGKPYQPQTGWNPAAQTQPGQQQQQQQQQQKQPQWVWNAQTQQWIWTVPQTTAPLQFTTTGTQQPQWIWNAQTQQWIWSVPQTAPTQPVAGAQKQPTPKEIRKIPLDSIDKSRQEYKEHKCSSIKDTKADDLEKFLRGKLRKVKNYSSTLQNELNDKERENEDVQQRLNKLYSKLSITLEKLYFPGKGEW